MAVGRPMAIIGISTVWGAELARRLEREPSVEAVFGIDSEPPPADLVRTEYLEADARGPVISRILPATGADTVAHCGILRYPEPGARHEARHERTATSSC